jgi:hypothetical protein
MSLTMAASTSSTGPGPAKHYPPSGPVENDPDEAQVLRLFFLHPRDRLFLFFIMRIFYSLFCKVCIVTVVEATVQEA